jgi:tetratricopeptide (TPR) repeat protein
MIPFLPHKPVLKRIAWLPALAALVCWSPAGQAQVYLPLLPRVDTQHLQREGNIMLQEAQQLAQIGQVPLALLRAQLATQLLPKDPDAWSILGGLYLLDQKPEEGIAVLEQAKKLAPREAVVWFRLGSAYFQKKDYAQAVNVLKQGLALKPDVPTALFDLGNAYLLQNRVEDAIATYEKAYAQDEKFWFPLNNLGLIRYEQGNINEAIRLWQKSIAIDDKEPEPKMALATALYARRGKKEAGIQLAQKAIKLNFRYADPNFLQNNLWGPKLLGDTEKMLQEERVQATIAEAEATATQGAATPR